MYINIKLIKYYYTIKLIINKNGYVVKNLLDK